MRTSIGKAWLLIAYQSPFLVCAAVAVAGGEAMRLRSHTIVRIGGEVYVFCAPHLPDPAPSLSVWYTPSIIQLRVGGRAAAPLVLPYFFGECVLGPAELMVCLGMYYLILVLQASVVLYKTPFYTEAACDQARVRWQAQYTAEQRGAFCLYIPDSYNS